MRKLSLRDLTLAEKLCRLRGDTLQKDAARQAGIPPATLCKLERGVRGVSSRPESIAQRRATLERLARAYGVRVEYLAEDLRIYLRAFAESALQGPGKTPGLRLRLVVDELGLRYGIQPAELAASLQLSAPDLAAYLDDRLRFAHPVFARLEEVVGVPADWLISGPPGQTDPVAVYRKSLDLAASSGVPPEVLEDLVRRWLDERREK